MKLLWGLFLLGQQKVGVLGFAGGVVGVRKGGGWRSAIPAVPPTPRVSSPPKRQCGKRSKEFRMSLSLSSSRTAAGGDQQKRNVGGGRPPENPDNIRKPSKKEKKEQQTQGERDDRDENEDEDADVIGQPMPGGASAVRLTIIQITDVYTLENFAHLKTLLQEKRRDAETHGSGERVISMLTGDFLSPYLLSSIDRGIGMMEALRETPVDYVTWGNHEADVPHSTVCQHVRNFPTVKWINTNMQSHQEMAHQKAYEVIDLCSEDGTHRRRVGLIAVLSDDKKLYSHFKAPGAFGGATIEDPWETIGKYKTLLEEEEGCHVVIPLQHTYVPDDHKTCRLFDFPVLLSGHDHHRVDEVVHGTRLLKPGLDAVHATQLELTWNAPDQKAPTVRATFLQVADWEADPVLREQTNRAYDALKPLRNSELARVPPLFEPLSSVGARGRVCSMGRFVCSLLRSSLNAAERQRQHNVDAVLLMGGNIRGGTDYPRGSFFSLEALEAEIKSDEVVGVVQMPGWLLHQGVRETHAGSPIPGWIQYDSGIVEQKDGQGVTHVDQRPIDMKKSYRVATKVSDLTNGQCPAWTTFYKDHPECLPAKGAYVNIHADLMTFFARNLWRKLWEAIEPPRHSQQEPPTSAAAGDEQDDEDEEECGMDGCQSKLRLEKLDLSHNGQVSVDEIHFALSQLLGLSVDPEEKTLAKFIHNFADLDQDGLVTVKDLELFCTQVMPRMYENQEWRLAFPRSPPLKSPPQATATTTPKETTDAELAQIE